MQVIVTKVAFYDGSLVYPSPDPIEVPDDTKGSWFVPADSEAAKVAKVSGKGKDKAGPQTLSELAGKGKTFNEVHAAKQAGDQG